MMVSQVNKCLNDGVDIDKFIKNNLKTILEESVPGDWEMTYSPKKRKRKPLPVLPDFKIKFLPSFLDSIMIEEKEKEKLDKIEEQKEIKSSFHNAIQNAKNVRNAKKLSPKVSEPVLKKTQATGKYQCPARKSNTYVSKKISKNTTVNINSTQDFPSL